RRGEEKGKEPSSASARGAGATIQNSQTQSRTFLDGLSYVLASRQREAVLAAVIPGPKTPMQVAKQTGLHLPHVSRTLGQLLRTDLVDRVAGQRRGRLYAASTLGQAVFGGLAEERGDRVVAPMIRGAHLRNYHHWVSTQFTSTAADEILIGAGLARNLRRPAAGPQEERDRHEGRLHAPRRSVLRIPDRLVRRVPPGGRRGTEQRLVTDW